MSDYIAYTTGSYAGDLILFALWIVAFVAVLAGLDLCATIYERARRWLRGDS